MNNLTAEQIKKIEENKRIALLKRNGVKNNEPSSNVVLPQQSASWQKRPFPKSVQNSLPVKKAVPAIKQEAAKFKLLSSCKFTVDMPFHEPSIALMKTIPGRAYESATKSWTFPVSEHDNLAMKLSTLKPTIVVSPLPKNVVSCLKASEIDHQSINIDKIDPYLRSMLLPFQLEGVKFGVSRKGRCMIADDMGLGKTIQALGIAHYFFESWPLLIVCPSSMRFPWESAILQFLPSIDPFSIVVMTSALEFIQDAKVVISSYDLLKSDLKKKKFGFIIFDESHFLKTAKSARTQAALEITPKAKHVVLLSGTPALSRPQELYPQIHVIDPTCFPKFFDFGSRYCDGKKSRFGWDYSGSSNTTELEIFMKRKFMIRRMKAEVQMQLPSKVRKVVVLHPKMVATISQELTTLASKLERQRGLEHRGTLLQYYSATALAKLAAVKEYIADKLETTEKMLIFGHHVNMLNGLSDLLEEKRVGYIRIDGTTTAETRASLCERFQTDPEARVAVLSIKAANSGLTLTAAQLVIFAELYWNPGELTQAEDRAHRIGQQDTVCVEYLIAKRTADDYLWSLVESKLRVLNSVGLSKDSFRSAGTEHLPDKHQPTIKEMFKNVKREGDGLTDLSSSQANLIADVEFDSLQEAFTEDDVFDSVDLETIEDAHCSKKRKS